LKTKDKNLSFTKSSIIELNKDQLNSINGGTGTAATVGTTSLIILTIAQQLK